MSSREKIKVGFCIAYDWNLLWYSIPQIYKQADVICLALDKNRQSWTGQSFSWDEVGFRTMIAELDTDRKIRVYEEDFYIPELQPMANEVRQRNMIAGFLSKGGWHIQLDADEYFLDFGAFTDYLATVSNKRKVNVCCAMINLYRQCAEGMLWIKPETFSQIEYFPIATRHPHYEYGRRNGYFNILTSYPLLHQSWARTEEEIWEKLSNWGHARDFDVKAYFRRWKDASGSNYNAYHNFHHLHPKSWPRLALAPGPANIDVLVRSGKDNFPLPITSNDLWKANSIWLSRAKSLVNKLKGIL